MLFIYIVIYLTQYSNLSCRCLPQTWSYIALLYLLLQLGVNAYAFVIMNNGHVVFHPKLNLTVCRRLHWWRFLECALECAMYTGATIVDMTRFESW